MSKDRKTAGPQLACEITPERIIAARATDDRTGLDSYTARAIASGVVQARLSDTNISNSDILRSAVSEALTTVGARNRDIVVVLPDSSVRIAVLEFDSLPEKKSDADGVIRFRLKKALPFDVDKTTVSYDILRSASGIRVVAAVVLTSVLEEYEAIFRDLGYAPGVVLPSTIAALGNVDSSDPVMVIKADAHTTTMAIVGDQQLLLFRTLENTNGVLPSGEQLLEDSHASMVFFEDTYNMKVTRIYVTGLLEASQVGPPIEAQTGIRVSDLVAPQQFGSGHPNFPSSALAGVVGVLLG
jgi:type IV pilus assembly protein PilM